MRLGDVDWESGTVRVLGKGRKETRLPLAQDAGEALIEYLDGTAESQKPTASSCVLTHQFARSAIRLLSLAWSDLHQSRTGIENAPSKRRPHLLRHSAATAMLRSGASLDAIGTVLRHQSTDMTAYYAKVDVQMLGEIAQPWPEEAPC